ncbi:MAG: hypothetical protein P4L84_17505 [Isosphaeraceae bacterium]|nr:hypothetical protein [Isosphaeraceae bacterium]
MALIRPRLTDHYDVPLTQEEADFVIPLVMVAQCHAQRGSLLVG